MNTLQLIVRFGLTLIAVFVTGMGARAQTSEPPLAPIEPPPVPGLQLPPAMPEDLPFLETAPPPGVTDAPLAESAAGERLSAATPEPMPTTLGEISYYVLIAELASRRGELQVALENYQIAARLSDDPRVAERATGMAMYVKDDAAALVQAKRWYQLDGENLSARQTLALALLRNGQVQPAIEHLDVARRASVDDEFDGFATLARLLEQAGDREIAYLALAQLRDRAPESRFGYYYFAVAAMRASRPEEALANLERALEIEPQWREALLLSTQVRIRQGDTEAALNDLGQAVLAQPSDRDLRLGYARLLISGQQLERARAQFELLSAQDPQDGDSLYALGLLAADAEQYDIAEEYFHRVLDLGIRNGDAWFELGNIAEQREEFTIARQYFEKVPEGERFLNAQVRAATVNAKMGDIDAMSNLLAALRVNYPNEAISLYITEADIYRELNQAQRSFDVLDQALLDHPDNRELMYARALAAERIDRLEILEQDLRTILAEDPDNAHALNALGYTLADRTDRLDEALVLLEKAHALLPDDPAVLDSVGWVYYKLGRISESLNYLRRAFEINDDAEIASHLAEVLWQMGERNEAREIWQSSIEANPNSKHLNRLRPRFESDD